MVCWLEGDEGKLVVSGRGVAYREAAKGGGAQGGWKKEAAQCSG